MIYELSVVAKPAATDADVKALQKLVSDVAKEHGGEVLVEDDWGRLTFAQPTSNGVKDGAFLYFIFRANEKNNTELNRRLKINESVLKYMTIVKGEDSEQEAVVKAYKTPYSKKYAGSVVDDSEEGKDGEKGQRRFSRNRSCWFTEKKISADWKDPKTYNWLINEFGKISPARVSGINRKNQRLAEQAIKRARQVGISSHVSNIFAG